MLVTVIATFGTTAPEGSVTVPTIVPVCAEATNEKANKNRHPIRSRVAPERSRPKMAGCLESDEN